MGKFLKISPIIGVVLLVGLIAYLFSEIRSREAETKLLAAEKENLQWELSLVEAKLDTIIGAGEYSFPETVIVSRTRIIHDTAAGRIDTVYEDIPTISGHIEIDTVKEFGFPGANPLGIRVYGKFYYPEEYSHRNRLLIYPVGRKPPYQPPGRPKMPKWGIGIACAIPIDQPPAFGAYGRSGRVSLGILHALRKGAWELSLNYEALRF